ncbi:MAG: glycosyltransferase family 39 protein [Omnitrophica bacterium]|nr:glycosyltransferase family 39 protein [Candidatus Omnitrophota bacterium]
MKNTQKMLHTILFASVLVLATYLRFYKISGSCFINPDEYLYYTGSQIGMVFKKLFFGFPDILRKGAVTDYVFEAFRQLPDFVRPGYHTLSAIGTFIMGESKATAFRLSAFFGVLTVASTYLLAKTLFDSRRIALLSSLLLAVTTSHVFFSRSGFQISPAIFFLTVAFYFYVRSRQAIKKTRVFFVFSAIFYSISFAVHPSLIYVAPIFILLELQRYLIAGPHTGNRSMILSTVKNLFIFGGAFLLTSAVWEIPYFFVRLYFILTGKIELFSNYFTALIPINNMMSYFGQFFLYRSHYVVFSLAKPSAFWHFPSLLIDSNGIIYFAALAAAIIYLFVRWRRNREDYRPLLLITWLGMIYILYTAIDIFPYRRIFKEARVFAPTLPAIAIIQAVFFDRLFYVFKSHAIKKIAAGLVFFSIICFGALYSHDLISTQFSYEIVNEYLKANPHLDRVVLNVNTMGMGPTKKVSDNLDGFAIPDVLYEYNGEYVVEKAASRIAVLYRNPEERTPIPMIPPEYAPGYRLGIADWSKIESLYKKGMVRYLLTSPFDCQWFRTRNLKADPIFHWQSPLVNKTRAYSVVYNWLEIGAFCEDPYFSKIGIYDLSSIFGTNDSLKPDK